MALIDIVCPAGHVAEVVRMVVDWPKTPPCPTCGEPTEQTFLPKATRWTVDPVVVYKAADGSFRFPGDANGLSAKQYERQGYERVELRGAADVRLFEKVMGKHEYSRAMRKVEVMQAAREASEKERRSQLRDEMRGMSAYGRDLAREAMRNNDNKPREYAKESGFTSEVYSYDRSSREAARDPQGRRRRD